MSVAIGPYLWVLYDPVVCGNPKIALGISWGRTVSLHVVHLSNVSSLMYNKCPPPPPAPLRTHTHTGRAHTLNKATKLFTTRTRARTLARTALDCTPQHADSGERERGARRHSRVAGALRTRCGPHRLPQLTPALTYPCAAAALGSE